jgi:hypothetical protein
VSGTSGANDCLRMFLVCVRGGVTWVVWRGWNVCVCVCVYVWCVCVCTCGQANHERPRNHKSDKRAAGKQGWVAQSHSDVHYHQQRTDCRLPLMTG